MMNLERGVILITKRRAMDLVVGSEVLNNVRTNHRVIISGGDFGSRFIPRRCIQEGSTSGNSQVINITLEIENDTLSTLVM